MIAQHTTPRGERIVVFEHPEEFESVNHVTQEDNANGTPLVIARRLPNADWAVEVHDTQTDLGYPDFRCGASAGSMSNLCMAIANGVVAMRTEPSTVVSI